MLIQALVSLLIALCGGACSGGTANTEADTCARVLDILKNSDKVSEHGVGRDTVPDLCEYMRLNQNSKESIRCLLAMSVESDTSADMYMILRFIPNTANRCEVSDADFLSAIASVIEVEPGAKRNLLASLLRTVEGKLCRDEALALYSHELPKQVEELDSVPVLLRHILGRLRAFGLASLSKHLEHQGALSEEDVASASLIDDAIRDYERSLVTGEDYDTEQGMSLLAEWVNSSAWLKRIYVLEGTKKFPEIVGIQKLEELSNDPNRIVRESAMESLTKLREEEGKVVGVK